VIERGKNMEQKLIDNYEFIQRKIEQIKFYPSLDIKQISDLQRYVEMQKNIIASISLLRGIK
jgi:hypothetical protein